MKRTAFDEARDHVTADQVGRDAQAAKALMCRAMGCPNRWTLSVGDKVHVCSAHGASDKHLWPRITQEQLDAQADQLRGVSVPARTAPLMSRQQALAKLRTLRFDNVGGKGWAHALREQELRGERLSPAQQAMWRQAIGEHHDIGQVEIAAATPEPEYASAYDEELPW